MKSGIIISEENHDVSDGKLIYDTRKRKLSVDLRVTPKHVDVFTMNGGTKWVTPKGSTNTEVLWSLEHRMPFMPLPLIYFYTSDAPPARSLALGQYTLNNALMDPSPLSSTRGNELLYVTVDETYIKIIHKHQGPVLGIGTSATANGSDFQFRIRYMVLNIPTPFTSSEGAG